MTTGSRTVHSALLRANSTFFVARVPSSCKVFERAVSSEVLRRDIMTDKMSQFVLIYGMFILNGCEDCTIQRRSVNGSPISAGCLWIAEVQVPLCNTHLLSFVNSTAVQFAIRSFLQDTTHSSTDVASSRNGRVADALQLTAGSREIRNRPRLPLRIPCNEERLGLRFHDD